MEEFLEKIIKVQNELKVPKTQYNNFGGYNYRTAEDILTAVKPLLAKEGLFLRLEDELVMIGERYYIKATAKIRCGTNEMQTVAFAREEENKKGMDGSQITGASSSYARKFALSGLFLIDDEKDSDFTNKGQKAEIKNEKAKCPKCGKEISPKMLTAWGMCADCMKKERQAK